MKPQPRNVIIKQYGISEKTKGELYLPVALQRTERENTGVIKFVGEGTPEEPMQYRVGDVVKFNPHEGREITINNEELRIINDTDIYCTIKNNKIYGNQF